MSSSQTDCPTITRKRSLKIDDACSINRATGRIIGLPGRQKRDSSNNTVLANMQNGILEFARKVVPKISCTRCFGR